MELKNNNHGREFYPQIDYSVDDILEELAFKKRGLIDHTNDKVSTSEKQTHAEVGLGRLKESEKPTQTERQQIPTRDFSAENAFDSEINEILSSTEKPGEIYNGEQNKAKASPQEQKNKFQSFPRNMKIPATQNTTEQRKETPEEYNEKPPVTSPINAAPVHTVLPRTNKVMSTEEAANFKHKETVKKAGLSDAQEFFESLKRASKNDKTQKSADVIYKKFEAPIPKQEDKEEKEPISHAGHTTVISKSDIKNQEKNLSSADEPTIFAAAKTFLKNKDELTGQVMMPGFEKSENSKEDDEWEEKWSYDRKQKIGTFKLENEDDKNQETNADDESEPSQPYDSMVIDDCEKISDIPVIRMDLIVRRRHIVRRIIMTSFVFFFMLLVSFAEPLKIDILSSALSPDVYLVTSLVLITLAAAFNSGAVFGGFSSLIKFAPDLDTPVSIGMMAAGLQTVVMLFFRESCANVSLFGTAAVFALIIGNIGKLLMVGRISKNFEMIADTDEKFCCNLIDNGDEVFEIGRGLTVGEASVCYEKTSNLPKNFLAHSFAQDPVDLSAQRTSPYLLLIGLIAAVLCFFFGKGESTGGIEYAVSALCAAVLMSLPFTSLISANLPLKLACKKLFNEGAMLSGYEAVEQFGDVNVLAVDAGQLFPEGTVQLVNIKNCGNIAIDRVLLDAAGVSITTGGPLAPVFKSILGGKTELIPDVDTLIYEEKMGISGWVTGHKVLIGNRALMDNHGIWIPNSDVFTKYEREGLQTVFLSNTGVLSAVFLLKYTADQEIIDALQTAVKKGLSLSVYSCDPNVNENMICELFDLPKNCVRVMNAPARRAFKQLTNEQGIEDATLVHCFDAGSLARGVTACIRLKRKISGVGVLQILMMILGLFLSIGMVLTMGVSGFSIGLMLAYQLLWLILTLITQEIL